MDYKKAFEKMMSEKYYPSRELKYDTSVSRMAMIQRRGQSKAFFFLSHPLIPSLISKRKGKEWWSNVHRKRTKTISLDKNAKFVH